MGDAQDKKPKVSGDDGEKYINMKVIGTDSSEIQFRVKMNTKLGKMKTIFQQKTGTTDAVFRYHYDGNTINDNDTPKTMKMDEEKDEYVTIEVNIEQFGGTSSKK